MQHAESEAARSPKEPEPTERGHPLSLATYFALTFFLAWTLWIAAAILTPNAFSSLEIRALLFLPGTFAPGIVAIWLTARAESHAGLRALLGRLFEWQVGAGWYLFALGFMAGIKLLAALLFRLLDGAWPAFGEAPWYLLFAATLFSTPFQAGEEIGWRGYALPRLALKMGLARASLLLGVLWAVWHLPLFFIPGTTTSGQSFPAYLLGVTALSVAMAWLYGHTRASLLLVMLMHAAINNTKDIVPSAAPGLAQPSNAFTAAASPVAWLTTLVLWVAAVIFLARMPRAHTPRP